MDSAGGSARGLSHISVELLGDMDKCPAIAFQANGHTTYSSIKIGQIVGFKHVLRNYGGAYHPNSNAFVAPADGIYFLGSTVLSSSGSRDLELHFFKNQKDYNIGCYEAGNGHTSCTMFAPMKLKTGDRVDIRCASTAGGDIWAGGDNKQRGLTNFRGFQIFSAKDPSAIAFQAVLPSSVKVSNGQVVPYKQMMLSVGGGYDASKARFTAPVSGVYSFGVNQLSGGGSSAVELAFFKNGGVYNIGCYDGEDSHTGCVMTTMIELCKGQYVEVRSRHRTSDLYGQSKRGLGAFYGYLTKGRKGSTGC